MRRKPDEGQAPRTHSRLRRGLVMAGIGVAVSLGALALLHTLNIGRGAAAAALIAALLIAYEVY